MADEYKCIACGAVFTSQGDLDTHTTEEHGETDVDQPS